MNKKNHPAVPRRGERRRIIPARSIASADESVFRDSELRIENAEADSGNKPFGVRHRAMRPGMGRFGTMTSKAVAKVFLSAACVAACLLLITPPLPGADPPVPGEATASGEGTDSTTDQRPDPAARIREITEILSASESSGADPRSQRFGPTMEAVREDRSRLSELLSSYRLLQTLLGKQETLQRERRDLRKRAAADAGAVVAAPAPYSLEYYDGVLGELAAARKQYDAGVTVIDMRERLVTDAAARLERERRTLRDLKLDLESLPPDDRPPEASKQIKAAELKAELAETETRLERIRLENARIEREIARLKTDLYRKQLEWIEIHLTFSREDLASILDAIRKERQRLEERLREVSKARNRLEKEEAILTASPDAAPAFAENEAAVKTIETRRAYHLETMEMIGDRIQLLSRREEIWRKRHALVRKDLDQDRLPGWKAELEDRLREITTKMGLEQEYRNTLQQRRRVLENRLEDRGIPEGERRELKERQRILERLLGERDRYIADLLETERLQGKLANEIDRIMEGPPLDRTLEQAARIVEDAWGYEIITFDDRPITVRKLVISLAALLVGLILAKFLVKLIVVRISSRDHFKPATVSVIEKILNYAAFTLVILFALRIVNIPLEAFAFLGGAIAIGIGFGAQNLINNFISGFILMLERPISVGDLVQVEGNVGNVEEIGARSTRIRTGENIHILVPNSSFLENDITNLTLSDRLVRAHVSVGVAYGSPVKKVEKILLDVLQMEEAVITEKESFVIFEAFGDNALIFEVYFWIYIRRIIEKKKVQSRLRFHIDKFFREAGIVIAFPQRDVHLFPPRPMEVRVLRDGAEPKEDAPA